MNQRFHLIAIAALTAAAALSACNKTPAPQAGAGTTDSTSSPPAMAPASAPDAPASAASAP